MVLLFIRITLKIARLQHQNYFYFYIVEDAMLTYQPNLLNLVTIVKLIIEIWTKMITIIDWRLIIGLQSKLGFTLKVNIINHLLNNSTYLNNTPNEPLIFNVLCTHNEDPLGVTEKII